MDAKVNFITLAVADVGASRAFYVDGLGWEPAFEAPGEILFISLSPTLVLSLWCAVSFEEEVGAIRAGSGMPPFTLAHNVESPEAVDVVLAEVIEAGGAILKPAVQRDWGGYSGYFTDPDGFVWEVAYNPGPIGASLMEAEGLLGRRSHRGVNEVVDAIRSRRSVGQGLLMGGPGLDHGVINEAVESARWAPNHKRTEPWRFYLLDEGRKARLADLWAAQLVRTGSKPERAEAKRGAWSGVSGVLVVTCTSAEDADEKTRLEDYAATACAVQNLCLHLWSKGIATKWSTAAVDDHEDFWPLLGHPREPAGTRIVSLVFYGLARELPKPHRKLGLADVLTDFRGAPLTDSGQG